MPVLALFVELGQFMSSWGFEISFAQIRGRVMHRLKWEAPILYFSHFYSVEDGMPKSMFVVGSCDQWQQARLYVAFPHTTSVLRDVVVCLDLPTWIVCNFECYSDISRFHKESTLGYSWRTQSMTGMHWHRSWCDRTMHSVCYSFCYTLPCAFFIQIYT